MKIFKDMDPITMILLTLGFINTANNMTNQKSTSDIGRKYINHIPSFELPTILKEFESGDITYKTAYAATKYEASQGRYTIGNGNTYIYDNNGKFIRRVKSTDTLSTLKVLTNNVNLSDDDFAKRLSYNHLIGTDTQNLYKKIANQLDIRGIVYHSDIANQLLQFLYGSTGILSSSHYKTFLSDITLAYTKSQMHSVLLKFHLEYVKTTPQWKTAYRAWTTRAITVAEIFSGIVKLSDMRSRRNMYDRDYNKKRIALKSEFGLSILI